MTKLTTPISDATIRSLKVGDEVQITGTLFTGRDAVHKYLHDGGKLPPEVAASWFGPNAISLVGLLMGRYRLSKRQVTHLLSGVMLVSNSRNAFCCSS